VRLDTLRGGGLQVSQQILVILAKRFERQHAAVRLRAREPDAEQADIRTSIDDDIVWFGSIEPAGIDLLMPNFENQIRKADQPWGMDERRAVVANRSIAHATVHETGVQLVRIGELRSQEFQSSLFIGTTPAQHPHKRTDHCPRSRKNHEVISMTP
jgi:hypothetical protein